MFLTHGYYYPFANGTDFFSYVSKIANYYWKPSDVGLVGITLEGKNTKHRKVLA